jgi:Zn-dependent peptidase ImmA (M78 family)/transcriptional regulator with XRE-family HTH domain
MLEAIASIVKAVRERARLSVADVSRESGVPVDTIASLERGQPGMATTELFDVARVLSLDPVALLGGRELVRAVPSVFLRHAGHQDFYDRDNELLDEALSAGRALASLRSRLGEPPAALQAGTFQPTRAAADRNEAPAREGYRLAGSVRSWVANTRDPLGDMGLLVEQRFGVAILTRALATARSTAASVRAEDAAGIVLNARDLHRKHKPLLARVHLAHELCHILFDLSDGGLHIVVDLDADRRVHAEEQRARAFAAELLLPLMGLVEILGDPRGVSDRGTAIALVSKARSHFGTPHEIAANHLCNLHFIDLRLRDHLEAESSRFTGTAPRTSLPLEGEASLMIRQYVQRAHEEGLLTDGEAKGLLGLDRLETLPWDEVAF